MFDGLIGNDRVKKFLRDSIESKSVLHSYIFSGPEGVGKRLFAMEYGKSAMCNEGGECNDTCDSCLKFNSSNNPDFMYIEPDGKNIKIDQIRKMQEKIAEKPIVSSRKVYIINDADYMTEESQNCLLKTLEECSKYAIIILIVSNDSKLLATIKSRCIIVKFEKIQESDLKEYFKEMSDEQIELLDGSFLHADSIVEIQEEYNIIKEIVDKLEQGTFIELMEQSDILYNNKDKIMEMLNYLNIILLQRRLIDCVEIVEKAKKKILANNNYEMCIDYLLLNLWKNK